MAVAGTEQRSHRHHDLPAAASGRRISHDNYYLVLPFDECEIQRTAIHWMMASCSSAKAGCSGKWSRQRAGWSRDGGR
jgi:hypothetical protein